MLAYPSVREAVEWLRAVFGFVLRLRIGDHRAQLNVGEGAVVVSDLGDAAGPADAAHSVMVRVDDVNGHHARAVLRGGKILSPPTDYSYGERQYTAEDIGGHVWTFSQSIADVDSESWGGSPGEL